MIEISKDLKKFIKMIPLNILYELDDITQKIPYVYNEEDSMKWRKIDEFSRQISYAVREHNNPEHVLIVKVNDGYEVY